MLDNAIKFSIIFIIGGLFFQAWASDKPLTIDDNIRINSLPLTIQYEKIIPLDIQGMIWTYLDDQSVISFSRTSLTQKSFYRDDFFRGKDGITMPLSFFRDDSTKFKYTYWFRKNLCNLFISNYHQFNAENNDKYIYFANFCKSINLRNLESMIRIIMEGKKLKRYFPREKKTIKKEVKSFLLECSSSIFGSEKTNNYVTSDKCQDIDREIDLIVCLNEINRYFRKDDPDYNTNFIL